MARIEPMKHEAAQGEARAAFDEGVARWGRMTSMKRTLLHSPVSYRVLMEWYTLFDGVKPFLGERLAVVFAHAISSESECPICTTYMRRILMDGGEDPDALALDDVGEALVAFGRAMVGPGNRVPDNIYARVAKHFSDAQMVALTSFAAMMVATNIINNVLEVELDEYLYEYREQLRNEGK